MQTVTSRTPSPLSRFDSNRPDEAPSNPNAAPASAQATALARRRALKETGTSLRATAMLNNAINVAHEKHMARADDIFKGGGGSGGKPGTSGTGSSSGSSGGRPPSGSGSSSGSSSGYTAIFLGATARSGHTYKTRLVDSGHPVTYWTISNYEGNFGTKVAISASACANGTLQPTTPTGDIADAWQIPDAFLTSNAPDVGFYGKVTRTGQNTAYDDCLIQAYQDTRHDYMHSARQLEPRLTWALAESFTLAASSAALVACGSVGLAGVRNLGGAVGRFAARLENGTPNLLSKGTMAASTMASFIGGAVAYGTGKTANEDLAHSVVAASAGFALPLVAAGTYRAFREGGDRFSGLLQNLVRPRTDRANQDSHELATV